MLLEYGHFVWRLRYILRISHQLDCELWFSTLISKYSEGDVLSVIIVKLSRFPLDGKSSLIRW